MGSCRTSKKRAALLGDRAARWMGKPTCGEVGFLTLLNSNCPLIADIESIFGLLFGTLFIWEARVKMFEIAGGIVLAVIALYVLYVMIMAIGRIVSYL